MSRILASGATNATPDTHVKAVVNCDELWGIAQQFSYEQLSEASSETELDLLDYFNVRARRIAATYARFYLEHRDVGGTEALKGRFYWMALGAFASKTVACVMESIQVNAMDKISPVADSVTNTADKLDEWVRGDKNDDFAEYSAVKANLAKGNFWLFMDIAPWTYFYSQFVSRVDPENPEARRYTNEACYKGRNVQSNLCPEVKEIVTSILPWADEAVGTLNNLSMTEPLEAGMAKCRDIEGLILNNVDYVEDVAPIQFKHLLDIAKHEQEMILQPLIYENRDFAHWSGVMRWPVIRSLSPVMQMVFKADCRVEDEELEEYLINKAPDDMIVENFQSRFYWIGKVAEQFHGLMLDKTEYMEDELKQMARWKDMSDEFFIPNSGR